MATTKKIQLNPSQSLRRNRASVLSLRHHLSSLVTSCRPHQPMRVLRRGPLNGQPHLSSL